MMSEHGYSAACQPSWTELMLFINYILIFSDYFAVTWSVCFARFYIASTVVSTTGLCFLRPLAPQRTLKVLSREMWPEAIAFSPLWINDHYLIYFEAIAVAIFCVLCPLRMADLQQRSFSQDWSSSSELARKS